MRVTDSDESLLFKSRFFGVVSFIVSLLTAMNIIVIVMLFLFSSAQPRYQSYKKNEAYYNANIKAVEEIGAYFTSGSKLSKETYPYVKSINDNANIAAMRDKLDKCIEHYRGTNDREYRQLAADFASVCAHDIKVMLKSSYEEYSLDLIMTFAKYVGWLLVVLVWLGGIAFYTSDLSKAYEDDYYDDMDS